MEGKDIFNIVATTISVAAAVLSAAAMILRTTNKKPGNEPQPNTYCYANTYNGHYNNNGYTRPQPQYVAPQPMPTPAPVPMPTPAPTQQTEELRWDDYTFNNTNQMGQTTKQNDVNPWQNTNMNSNQQTYPYGYYTGIIMPNPTPSMNTYNGYNYYNYPYYGYGYGYYDNIYQYPNYPYWGMGYVYPSHELNNYDRQPTYYTETFSVPGCKNQTWVGKSEVNLDDVFDKCQQQELRPPDECSAENRPSLMPLTDEPDDDGIVQMFNFKQPLHNNIAV